MADRKISDLTALTTPASGDFLPIVDISEAAAASKNKRITIEELMRGVPDGTAAAPGIAFETDPNTGIYRPGADQLAVATNGTGRLYIAADGKIGVNVSSPTQAQLVVASSAGANTAFFTDGTNSSIKFLHGGGGAIVTTESGQYLGFGTSDTERLRITSAGLVGIGTSSPVSTLTVNGIGAFGANSGSADVSAARELYIRGAGDSSLISFQTSSTGSNGFLVGQIADQARIQVVDAHPLTFHTTNTERVRITSAGLVGVGTSSPGAKLVVDGGTSGDQLRLGTDPHYYKIGRNSASGPLEFYGTQSGVTGYVFGGVDGTRLTIDSSGRVGIGTTPASVLHVNQPGDSNGITLSHASRTGIWKILHSGVNSENLAFIQYNGTSDTVSYLMGRDLHYWQTGGTERARIDSSGRLLVGTSSTSATNTVVIQGHSGGSTGQGIVYLAKGAATPADGDQIGAIWFSDNTHTASAGLNSQRDGGTWSGTSKPSRLVFSTTPSGSASPVERVRIGASGYTQIYGPASSTASLFQVTNSTHELFFVRNDGLLLTGFGANSPYNLTTASAANVFIESGASLRRSTSSIKYKTNVETLEDAYADAILNARPVWYRSICEGDNAEHGWWGFIAEEIAEIDPRLVHWKTVETSLDEDGNRQQIPCDPEPEGVQYDRFVPHLVNLIKRQKQQIEAMEARLSALEAQ
jgi:hypothetical protein